MKIMDKYELRNKIGTRIESLRKERGLSIARLAAMADITAANLNNIEKGRYSVGLEILGRICETLECSIELEKWNSYYYDSNRNV